MFIQVFFKLLADKEVPVQEEAWSALSVLVKRLDAAEQLQHVGSLRQAMRYASDEIKRCGGLLPGFCGPKKVWNDKNILRAGPVMCCHWHLLGYGSCASYSTRRNSERPARHERTVCESSFWMHWTAHVTGVETIRNLNHRYVVVVQWVKKPMADD